MADEKELERMSKKLDGVADDVRSLSFRVDKLENKLDTRLDVISDKLDIISGQRTSVVGKVIEHDNRLGSLEGRVDVIEAEAH
ncbi:MAG: hypothetical protein JO314_03565 [Acidobacteria bacterium]|nr:hypothetical protein [Acidobacteriota bacterium]